MMTSNRRGLVVGLYSPAMQSGKSTFAEYLEDRHGFVRVPFAAPLKRMAAALFTSFADQDAVHRMTHGDLKGVPQEALLGHTPRYVMQTLGTEWRDMLGRELWTNIVIPQITSLREEGYNVVVEDMRFHHEYGAIKDLGGLTVEIIRPGIEVTEAHASEGALDDAFFDEIILNSGTVEDLYAQADAFYDRHR